MIHYNGLFEVFVLSLATTAISVTISKSEVFSSTREFIAGISHWLGELVSCSYCLSHWVAIVFVAIYKPVIIEKYFYIDLIVSMFAIVTISAILSGIIIKMKGFGIQKPTKNTITGD